MRKTSVHMLTIISLLAALTFISYYFRIPIGPVPFTLQTALIILTGLLLPPFAALACQSIHLILMILFNNALLSPTLGYLIGFIVAAALISWLSRKSFHSRAPWFAILMGEVAIHLIGFSYLAWVTISNAQGQAVDLVQLATVAILPFLIPDFVKAVLAYWVAQRLNRFKIA